MLRAYIRRLKSGCVDTARYALSGQNPPRQWVKSAFRDFIALDGRREAMFAKLAAHARRLASRFHAWLGGGETSDALAQSMLNACALIDDKNVWHRELKYRSYVDISIQMKVLRIFIDYLASISADLPTEALELTELLLEHEPNSRPALLVHAELLIEKGEADAAIESIQRALRVQAVCTTAQEMLFRAYRIERNKGSTAPELDALDYDLTDKFCHLPFTHLSTGFQGDTFACACPAWVPFSIGNILKADSAEAVWNSDVAMEIRRSVLDGDFSYCSRTQCSYIAGRRLPRKSEITNPGLRALIDQRVTRVAEMPDMVELNHDPTCNLACPSCRTEIIAAKSEEIDVYARATERVILPLLRKVNGQTYISGGGEAFASKHFRSILRSLNRAEYPGLGIHLISNGQLLTPRRWEEFPHLAEMIDILTVSIDAARPETYEMLRRPGKWAPLMKNLAFVAGMRRDHQIRALGLNFVVQKENFREIPALIALAESFGADQIWLQRIVNYGSYDESTFAEIDVTSSTHPDHPELLEILRDPLLKHPSVNMHMLQPLLPELVASEERLEFLYEKALPGKWQVEGSC